MPSRRFVRASCGCARGASWRVRAACAVAMARGARICSAAVPRVVSRVGAWASHALTPSNHIARIVLTPSNHIVRIVLADCYHCLVAKVMALARIVAGASAPLHWWRAADLAMRDWQVQWGEQDDYEVVRKVGRGKYSEVFEGIQVLLSRPRASRHRARSPCHPQTEAPRAPDLGRLCGD